MGKFTQDVLRVLGKSLEVNQGLEQRPAFQNAKGGDTRYTVYKALGGSTLNPRELRFIICNYGLAGTKKSELELRVMEGISQLDRMKTNAKWNLISGLSSLQDERKKPQPQADS